MHVKLKENGVDIVGTEGEASGEWVLVDAGDVVVHVMLPAVRDYYDIEALWGRRKAVVQPERRPPVERAVTSSRAAQPSAFTSPGACAPFPPVFP